MNKFDRDCPNCGNKTLDSENNLFFCNDCGFAPNRLKTIKCPICNNYEYQYDDETCRCETCGWEFDKSKITECDYRSEWTQKEQNNSLITAIAINTGKSRTS